MRKGRPPSPEEQALFRSLLPDIRPVKARALPPVPPHPPETTIRADRVPLKVPVENDAHQAQSLGGHRAAHARRGRLEPAARLDLHGLTRENAFRALVVFLRRAQMQNMRLVLVITGKSGVLRESVPRWLAQGEAAELNSGVSSAHIRHGGEGALYIGIKAAKPRKP